MEQKRVIALGFFDGVHLGHGALLRRVTERAGELNAIPAAVTFDAHPKSIILGQGSPLLTTPSDRADLMQRLYGIRDIIVTPFDDRLMHMDWRAFVTDYLVARNNAVHLVAGHDFRFGYMGQGNAQRLQQLCAQLGIGCDIIPSVSVDEITVSSTYIRTLVAQGEMERAAQFLGHPFCLTEQVRHGKKLGSRLGFPTVNLRFQPGVIVPAHGVYATLVTLEDGSKYPAVTNVGVRPTVDDNGSVTVEGYLLGFSGDLYAQRVHMEFYKFLRKERKFATLEELQAEVQHNAQEFRRQYTCRFRSCKPCHRSSK